MKRVDKEETTHNSKKRSSDEEWDWKDFDWSGCDEDWSSDGD